jgi:hypothetical protein
MNMTGQLQYILPNALSTPHISSKQHYLQQHLAISNSAAE